MICAACVNSVKCTLRDLPGVKRAVVALAREKMIDIVTAIEDAGFEGSLVQSNQQDRCITDSAW